MKTLTSQATDDVTGEVHVWIEPTAEPKSLIGIPILYTAKDNRKLVLLQL